MQQIALSGKKGAGQFVLVDDEDYPVLSRIKWSLSSEGYARNRFCYMHQMICGFPKGPFEIDHIDNKRLNNQKGNLRLCTRTDNIRHSLKTSWETSSKYKGVYYSKRANRWIAQIKYNGKSSTMAFVREVDAAVYYDLWAIELFGRFAKTNFKVIAHSGGLAASPQSE